MEDRREEFFMGLDFNQFKDKLENNKNFEIVKKKNGTYVIRADHKEVGLLSLSEEDAAKLYHILNVLNVKVDFFKEQEQPYQQTTLF
jgi:predicted RNA-binding protein